MSNRRIVLPSGAKLSPAGQLNKRVVLDRNGWLSFSLVLPPIHEGGYKDLMLVRLEGQQAWRTKVLSFRNLSKTPDSIDLGIERLEVGFDRSTLSAVDDALLFGALVVRGDGAYVCVKHGKDEDEEAMLVGLDLERVDAIQGLGMVATNWTLFGYRGNELVLKLDIEAATLA